MKWCYECYLNNTKLKGIIKKIIYNIWLKYGIKQSKLYKYTGKILMDNIEENIK